MQKTTAVILMAFLLAGCNEGGGNKGDNNTPNQTNNTTTNITEHHNSTTIVDTQDLAQPKNSNPNHINAVRTHGEKVRVIEEVKDGIKTTRIQQFNAQGKLYNTIETKEKTDEKGQRYSSSNVAYGDIDLKQLNTIKPFDYRLASQYVENIARNNEKAVQDAFNTTQEKRTKQGVGLNTDSAILANEANNYKFNQSYESQTQFVSNTFDTDTSTTWNQDKFKASFFYDRLMRDELARHHNIAKYIDSTGAFTNTDKLNTLVDPELSKILIIDRNPVLVGRLNEDNLSFSSKFARPEPKGDITHGDYVLYPILGVPSDNPNLDEADEYNAKRLMMVYPSPVYKKAPVFFALNGDPKESEMIEEGVSKGHGIINASYTYEYEFGKDGPELKAGQSIMDYAKEHNLVKRQDEEYYGAKEEVRHFNELNKKYDTLFINALGNEQDKMFNFMNLIAYGNKEKYKNYLDSTIMVGSYNPLTDAKADYANSCLDFKNDCLVANDREWFPLKKESHYFYSEGTSIATPVVTATAALVKSVFPFMTANQIKTTLLTTAKDLGAKGVDDVYGWGVLQASKAVNGPAQFYDKDFHVDFGYKNPLANNRKATNTVYRFANDISGQYGLTLSGDERNNVLSLSGFNTYEGDTIIEKGGLLNIDGVQKNSKTVIHKGHLYGSGQLNTIVNQDHLHAYSYFRELGAGDLRANNNMIVDGNYHQDQGATLHSVLGLPLAVTGQAHLDGGLEINGVHKAFISKDNELFEDVVVSQNGMTGEFKQFTSAVPFLNPSKLTYNILKDKGLGTDLYTATAFLKFTGFKDGLEHKAVYHKKADKLDSLHAKLSAVYDAHNKVTPSTSTQSVKKDVAGKEKVLSSAMDTIAELQRGSVETTIKTLNTLSGHEFVDASKQNAKTLSRVNGLGLIKHLNGNGLSVEYEKGKYDHQTTLSGVIHDGRHTYSLQLGKGSYKQDNQYDNLDLMAGYSYEDFLKFTGQLSYDEVKNKVNRTNEIANKVKSYRHDYKDRYFGQLFALSKPIEWSVYGQLEPFVAIQHQFINQGQVGEFNGFQLARGGNTRSVLGMVGVNYQYRIQDFDLNASYLFAKTLKKPSEKMTFGDDVAKESIINQYGASKHILKIGAKYHLTNNWSVGINASVSDKTQFGLELGYKF